MARSPGTIAPVRGRTPPMNLTRQPSVPRAAALASLVLLLLAAGRPDLGACRAGEEPARPAWKVVKTERVQGFDVSLSAPVLVARSKGYLWFPTLVRLGNDDLLAVMSNYADVHTTTSTSRVAWSGDGGLTWTE